MKNPFKNASADFKRANPQLDGKTSVEGNVKPLPALYVKRLQGVYKRGMNRTEAEYALILEAQKQRGEILRYEYEGITLKLADRCRFTPDFFIIVSESPLKIKFVETKGRHVWEDSKVKFRVAAQMNSWAKWEMWQKSKAGWSRII